MEELKNNSNCNQCQNCQQQQQSGDCSPQGYLEVGIGDARGSSQHGQASPENTIPKPTSWLPATSRRQRQDADDIEASAESPNESTCLITPSTDDEASSSNTREYGGLEESIAHREDSEAVIKKKGKKGGKKSAVGTPKGQVCMQQGHT